jgi:hypothetical protein
MHVCPRIGSDPNKIAQVRVWAARLRTAGRVGAGVPGLLACEPLGRRGQATVDRRLGDGRGAGEPGGRLDEGALGRGRGKAASAQPGLGQIREARLELGPAKCQWAMCGASGGEGGKMARWVAFFSEREIATLGGYHLLESQKLKFSFNKLSALEWAAQSTSIVLFIAFAYYCRSVYISLKKIPVLNLLILPFHVHASPKLFIFLISSLLGRHRLITPVSKL